MTLRRIVPYPLAGLIAAALPVFGAAQGGRPPGPGRAPGEEIKIVKQFDRDGNGRLDADERKAAREFLETTRGRAGRGGRMGDPAGRGGRMGPPGRGGRMGPGMGPDGPMGPGRGGRGGPGGRGRGRGGNTAGTPGVAIAPADVRAYDASTPLYDPLALRTIFLDFEDAGWEDELMAFHDTDVEVPATMVVDGGTYKDVGVHFRGMSSFMTVPAGLKHSLNVSLDFVHDAQNVGGYRTLNLLNSHEDPTYLRSILYYEIARSMIPAPNANYARVVINGENWGPFVSVQQFNKDFTREWFGTADGARWKVPGSPGARGGLEYLGDDPAAYKASYEIKSKDDPKAWAAFVALCRTLNRTPIDRLESSLAPMLDVDGALKFLALDAALVNGDGYWVRASDYSIYLDPKGRFHILPQDANETFTSATLDPLVGLDDPTKPLRSRLLAVPSLRAKYLAYVHEIATTWLDWKTLEPLVSRYQSVIADDVRKDTRKLDTFEAFQGGVEELREFVERRREYLLTPRGPERSEGAERDN
jgi:spore coat protein CotH